MHQRELALLADGAFLRGVVGQVELEGAGDDGDRGRGLGAGAVHDAGNAHADAVVFLDDTLGLEAGNTGGDDVLRDDAALTRVDPEALEGHDVVDALGEDGALAHLAAQLVGVDDAAHGGADHDVDVQLLELLGNRGHDLGGLVGVLLQKCHLAVSAGVAPGGKQEVPL